MINIPPVSISAKEKTEFFIIFMALTKEFMGSTLLERSFSVSSSDFQGKLQKNLLVNPAFFVPVQPRRSVHLKKTTYHTTPVAAISEDLAKASVPAAEKAVKFKVRAILTVRKNIKEDFKEQLVNHLDAITDKIGRNVVLTLLSTELDPSKFFFSFLYRLFFFY